MKKIILKANKAQNFTEYSVMVAFITIAIITLNLYINRGLRGRYADLVDTVTTGAGLTYKQFEVTPETTQSVYSVSESREITQRGGRKTVSFTPGRTFTEITVDSIE